MHEGGAMIDDILEQVVTHLGLDLTADLLAVVTGAGRVAVDVFNGGGPTPGTALALMDAAVKAGVAALPVDLPRSAKDAIRLGLVAGLAWLWREVQPVIIVEAADVDLVVDVVE